MKFSAQGLINHVEKASIGGLVNEIVFDSKFRFAVTDEAKAVLAISKKEFESDLGVIGIYNVDQFKKTVYFAASSIFNKDELDVVLIDNRLVFKNGDDEVKYLLCNTEIISSTVHNPKEAVDKLLTADSIVFEISAVVVDKLISSIELIGSETLTIYVSNNKILCTVGKETEHNIKLELGLAQQNVNENSTTVVFKSDVFIKVLKTVPKENITCRVKQDFPMIFSTVDYLHVIAPIA